MLLVVIIIRHGDEQLALEARTAEDNRFQGPRRASVAVEKRVNGGKVVMQCEPLDERIMGGKFALDGIAELPHGFLTLGAAIDAAMTGLAEAHVLLRPAKLAGRTMIVIAAGDNVAM